MAKARNLTLLVSTLLISACSSGNTVTAAHDAGNETVDSAANTVVDSSAPATDDAATDDAATDDAATVDAAPAPPYPKGTYGVKQGNILPPTLEWQAYLPGATTPTTLKVTDLYDPDHTKGINAIVFDSSGQWCIACQYEASQVPHWLSSTPPNDGKWTALGVAFVTLVIQTNTYEPATIVTADQWRTLFNLGNFSDVYVAADPAITFPTSSLPNNVLVDPATMKVVDDDLDDGYGLDGKAYNQAGDDEAGTGEAPNPAVAELAKMNIANAAKK